MWLTEGKPYNISVLKTFRSTELHLLVELDLFARLAIKP